MLLLLRLWLRMLLRMLLSMLLRMLLHLVWLWGRLLVQIRWTSLGIIRVCLLLRSSDVHHPLLPLLYLRNRAFRGGLLHLPTPDHRNLTLLLLLLASPNLVLLLLLLEQLLLVGEFIENLPHSVETLGHFGNLLLDYYPLFGR